ncbi:MAG TPA: serine/threonine-protein kinase [Pirellulales bacterium]|nr:serine/threonine-protein kinase [Pirellulales bacterium]
MNYDRQLLFGILAWVVGFVSRDALLTAARSWSTRHDGCLVDLLVAGGTLTAEQRALVEKLVEQQLSRHQGDAAQILARLPAANAVRGELEPLVAHRQHSTLAGREATLAATEVAPAAAEQPAAVAAAAELRFRLLRPHAHGGLGEVYVAHDAELKREVALKRIRDTRLDTPENRARFILEAEVTGGLEHPGIVPVYSLGTSDDGRPFYAMRFIRGESLKEAIQQYHRANSAGRDEGERLLELRKLLARFIDVCNAIEYAHSRGVLHRDLKPANIMLGAYGETLVVDWGLAKPIGTAEQPVAIGSVATDEFASQSTARADELGASRPAWTTGTAPTQMGAAIGTPAYMSPEQAAGSLDRIGVPSDVYSLGATLYCLLTGQAPFEDESLARVLERARRGDLRPPRTLRPEIPAALEAICLKAMALEPADRYASPRALAEELERWLADEPVAAHRAEWHERLARWARRHRRGVEAAAAALVLVSAISVVAALLVHSAKQQAEHERDATRVALEAETAAKRQAHAALAAEREARLEARRALDNYVSMVTEEETLEGDHVQALRKRLLGDALAYYEKLLDEDDGDGRVRHDLASAILRVGRIHHTSGSREEALSAFRQALAAFEELVEKHPDRLEYQRDLALCHRSLAELKAQADDLSGAADDFGRSLAVWQRIVNDHSPTADRGELADAWYDLGQAQAGLERWQAAQDSFQRSIAILHQLVELEPTSVIWPSALGRANRASEAAIAALGHEPESAPTATQP